MDGLSRSWGLLENEDIMRKNENEFIVDGRLLDDEDMKSIEEFFNEENNQEVEEMLGLLVLSLRLIDTGLYLCQGDDHRECLEAGCQALKDALGMLDSEQLKEIDEKMRSDALAIVAKRKGVE
jgi:hypothetical protein